MRSAEEIKGIFESKGVDVTRPMVFTCGGGVMTTMAYAGAVKAGFTGALHMYDGSWSEYNVRKTQEAAAEGNAGDGQQQ